MGLALGIVLECDLIVAAAGTKFQVTETSRGLGGAKYWALLNFRGAAAFATEVTLTGRFFTAEEALAAGIINRVAPEGHHLEIAYELAAEVAKNPPLSVRATVRTRRWYMDQLEREVAMQTAPLKLYCRRTSRKPPAPSRKSASLAPSRAAERRWPQGLRWGEAPFLVPEPVMGRARAERRAGSVVLAAAMGRNIGRQRHPVDQN
jgi:hypothetical protein